MARIDAWTLEQDDMLATEWGLWPDEEVAEWLGRTVQACVTRAGLLGIRKRDNIQAAIERGRQVEPSGRYRRAYPSDRRGWSPRKVA